MRLAAAFRTPGPLVLAFAVAVAVAATAGSARAQQGVVTGTVLADESGLPLAYAGVVTVDGRYGVLASAEGRFALTALPAGAHRLRFRRVGFRPLDTLLTVAAADTLVVTIRLERQAISLAGMTVTATCLAGGEDVTGRDGVVNSVLTQIRANADKFRLLVKEHPFTTEMATFAVVRHSSGEFSSQFTRTYAFEYSEKSTYRKGQVFRRMGGSQRVVLPTLVDFGDPGFMSAHCFAYGGEVEVDTNRFVRIRYEPAPDVHKEDIFGVVTLRSDNFELMTIEMETTGVPSSLRNDTFRVRTVTHFREIFPGISVPAHVESFITPGPKAARRDTTVATYGEVQTLRGVSWKKGPP